MRVTLPVAMNISMAGRTGHEKPDGLPSPERSGTPELKPRSSWQRKRDRLAYASKEDAHQIDDWPEVDNRKSQDVLVRYKDNRGSKGLSARMDPHVWSDLPTDTDDEVAENAEDSDWNVAHDAISPKSTASKVESGISMQQPKTTISRNLGGMMTQSEVKVQYLASADRWETVDMEGASGQEAEISTVEKEFRSLTCSTKLITRAATEQNDSGSPCRAADGGRMQEGDDACEKPEDGLKSQRNPPGRISYRKPPPRAPSQKAIDEQATMKMSHRYYTSGKDSSPSRRKIPSLALSRSAACKDSESEEEDKHCGGKRKEKGGTDHYNSKTHRVATNERDSVKELTDLSSTSSESECSEVEYGKATTNDGEEDLEESFREMILQKYLVMIPRKAKKGQLKEMASADTKQKVGRGKPPATSPTKACPDFSKERYFTGKNLHPISRSSSRSPSRTQLQCAKKKPYRPELAPHARQSVSQPAAVIREAKSITCPAEAPPKEFMGTKSPTLRKSWSTGDLHHSKSLGEIDALKGHALTHREICDTENLLTEKEKRAIDYQLHLSKDPKVSVNEASQTVTSGDGCFAIGKIDERCPPPISEGHSNFTNFCIRPVEVSIAPDDIDSARANTSEEATMLQEENAASEFRCEYCSPSVLKIASKTSQLSLPSGAKERALGTPDHQRHGSTAAEQGLSALALFSGPTETSDIKSCKPDTNDLSAPLKVVGMLNLDGSDGSDTHRIAVLKQANRGKGAEESSDGRRMEQAKHGKEAEAVKRGLNKQSFLVKKVPAVIPFDSCEDDQVLPDVSLAGYPASHTFLELQEEVESRQQQIADERRHQGKQVIIQQRSTEQRWGTEKPAQQKRIFRDARQALQKEKQTLLKHLQELEPVHHPCNRLKAMSGTKAQLTEEDARKLRQEILEQEALIRGYQVENEKAVAKLKEVQLESKQKLQEMAEERAVLASQLANRHMQSGYGTDSVSSNEKLQGALSRESALRIDLDKIRDAYMDLEKRMKTEESTRVKDLELKLTALQETLDAERQSHAQMEGRKQAMIQQEELIASLQETISDQASKIRTLTIRLEGVGEVQGKLTCELDKQYQKEGVHNDVAQQQIEGLQNQVKRLEASLRAAKKETGLHALQVAKSGMEENEAFRRLQAELVAVQRHALQRDEETNRILHHLKVENDKIKNESATRIRNLKQQIQTQAQGGHPISESELCALNRVKDLEKQVANLRIHYSRKVKELTDKLGEAKPEVPVGRNKPKSGDNPGIPTRVVTTRLQPVNFTDLLKLYFYKIVDKYRINLRKMEDIHAAQGKALREAKERIALQEDVLSQKDRTIKSLQNKLQAMESTGAVASMEREKQARYSSQEVQCSLEQEQGSVPNRSGSNKSQSPNAAEQDEVAALRRELEKAELTREVLQKACHESVEKTVLLTLQHQQALQLHQMRHSQLHHHRPSDCQSALPGWGDHRSRLEGINGLSERSSLEMANRALEARLKLMAEELEEAQSLCQQSPRMTQILNLKKSVAEMEAHQQQKEMEWQMIVQNTKQASSIEQEYAERKWREALESKSVEVEKLRLELNNILEVAMTMQQAQIQMNRKT